MTIYKLNMVEDITSAKMGNILIIHARRDIDAAAVRERLNTDGVVLFRSLLSEHELVKLRNVVLGHFRHAGRYFGMGKVQPNAAIHVMGLASTLAHPRIADVFKAALDTEAPLFTGHCDIHKDMLSGWHKDSGPNGGYFRNDCFAADDCRVYKIGLYLQDHRGKDGLSVQVGSHRTGQIHKADGVHIDSRAGDAILFDVRLTHAGQFPDRVESLLRRANTLLVGRRSSQADNRAIFWLKSLYWRAMRKEQKLSVFFTCGARNQHTVDFSRANMQRQRIQAGSMASEIPRDIRQALTRQGIGCVDCDLVPHD